MENLIKQFKRIGNYILIDKIGHGAFAEVYKGMHQTTYQEFAIKVIPRPKIPEEEVDIEKEIQILREIQHKNIVKFIEYQKTSNNIYLVFEYCQHGDLDQFIRRFFNGRVPESEAQKLIQQIIEGIKAMKVKNIVHRDLKLANILISKDLVLKIGDFGLARFIEKKNLLLKTYAGTPLNMDPCIFERKGYTDKCDIWSLGVIFYQILVGRAPYNPGRGGGIEDVVRLIKFQPLIFPESIPLSDSVKQLIKSMLVYDVNKRISFDDLFNHCWITGKSINEDLSRSDSWEILLTPKIMQTNEEAQNGGKETNELLNKEEKGNLE